MAPHRMRLRSEGAGDYEDLHHHERAMAEAHSGGIFSSLRSRESQDSAPVG